MLEFDFSNINEDNRITKEFIESKLSHEEIYCRYLGDVDFRKGVKSPFNADRTPSCKFFVRDNKLFWKDFSSGKSGDVFKLLTELNPTESFPQILERIAKDFGLMNGKNSYTQLVKKTYILPESKPADIKVVPRDWDEATLNYWKQYDIRLETLKLFNVRACQEVWIEDKPFYMYNKNNPAYRYTINKGFKIYQPLASDKKNKWRTNISSKSIWGLEQLRYKNDTVFIVSSVKDCMVMYEMGFESVNLNSETCAIPENLIKYLKNKYEYVIIFLDADSAGLQASRKEHKKWDIPYLFLPLTLKIKDQSDAVKELGMLLTKETIMDLLNTFIYGR